MVKFNTTFKVKLVALVILFIATVIGCHGHFTSTWIRPINGTSLSGLCRENGWICPYSATTMEQAFVGSSIICLILSTGSLFLRLFWESPPFYVRLIESSFHALAGPLMIICGVLIIVAATNIDNLAYNNMEIRAYLRFGDKVTAGGLSMVEALFHPVIAWKVYKKPESKPF